ncbi:MAG: Hsp20/alpha crystallin family protein [Methanophagales archaeon]|nr:Hsp20/alpha crystallin family protein [Methanophagales archaeon]
MDRWFDPFEELRRLQERMYRLFKEIEPSFMERKMLPATGGELATVEPFVDVIDNGDKVVVAADIPGVEKEDLSVNISGDMLEISAERKKEAEEKKEGYVRRERTYTSYYRAIPLPAEVDADKADATFENGVLEISMPKIQVPEKKKKIEIK